MVAPITRFSGQYHFLSNFYWDPIKFEDKPFNTAEHAYQWCKADLYDEAEAIRTAKTPYYAKRLGRLCALRPYWEENKNYYMHQVLRTKFSLWKSTDPLIRNNMARLLWLTGDAELIEGNTWGDTYWGQCPLGNGENMLGKLLMKVRSEIQHGF